MAFLSALCRPGPSSTSLFSPSEGSNLHFSINRFQLQVRTATKRGGGSTKNTRGSAGRRLGVKKLGGQEVTPGQILVRQRGFKFHPGQDVYAGKDHTLHAGVPGFVRFYSDVEGESVGYKSLLARRNRGRQFVGIVRERDDKLPHDEVEQGRARYFGLVDLKSLPPPEEAVPIPASTHLNPSVGKEGEEFVPPFRYVRDA